MSARTYGSLAFDPADGGSWVLERVEPHVSIRLKQIFPRIARHDVCPYRLRHSNNIAADLVWFLDRYPMAMADDDRAVLTGGRLAYLNHQAEMERILLPDWKPPAFVGMRPGQALRDYQTVPIELVRRSRGLLVGDECGLGKTYEGAGACLIEGALPAAIVCQTHIQRQWVEKLQEFTTLRVHAIKKASPYALPPADVYVFRYSQLIGWADYFATGFFKAAIYDEPQELRTGTGTGKGSAAKILSLHADYRMGLTATPIYGYGVEIYNVMKFINGEILGDYDDFYREFVGSGTGKLKDPKALGAFLRENYAFLRRTKKDVGRELAPISRIVHTVAYDAKSVSSIEDLARSLAIKATTASFMERGQAARELDILVRQQTGIAKAKGVADFVRMLVEGETPVVLFGWHRAVYDIWMRELRDLNPMLYTGSESPSQKARAKEAFLSGETNLLIMSLRSAAGLDGLQARCSTVAFGELDWSPGIHHQDEERVNRDGQPDPVTSVYLVCDDGSDPPMMELLGVKASEARQVVDPSLGVETVNVDETRLRALARRYLDNRQMRAA